MTEADISSTIATLFAASKAACSLFYLPQIYAVWRTTTGARDMALPTWSFFALSNALGVAYAVWVQGSTSLALSFALCMCGAGSVAGITVFRRWEARQKIANPADNKPANWSAQNRISNAAKGLAE